MDLINYSAAAGFAFLLCTVLTYALRAPAIRIGLVDEPDTRKMHHGTIPLTGGIAMFLSFVCAILVFDFDIRVFAPFLAATCLLFGIGLLDDVKEIRPIWRIVTQCLAVLIMCLWANVSLTNVGDILFFGAITLGWLSIPFTVFAVVGAVNATNMADGLDGLAGGLTLIAFTSLALLAWDADRSVETQTILVFVAIVLGFLIWNARSPWRKKAAAFMGDSGSTFLGLAVAWFMVQLSQGPDRVLAPITGLWLFAIPIVDTLSITIRRIKKRKSPFRPGRDHLHHILQDAGYSPEKTAMTIWTMAVICALIGIGGHKAGVPDGIMFCSFLLFFFTYARKTARSTGLRRMAHSIHSARERLLAHPEFLSGAPPRSMATLYSNRGTRRTRFSRSAFRMRRGIRQTIPSEAKPSSSDYGQDLS